MPGPFREWPLDCKVYVGDLGDNATEHELDSAFSKYGRLRNIWIARRPPGFAFIEFEDPRDAEDSCRGLDGTRLCGSRVRVEMSSGRSRRGGRRGPPGPSYRSERYYPDDRDKDRERGRERKRSPPRRRSRSGERHKSYSGSPRRSRSRSADRN